MMIISRNTTVVDSTDARGVMCGHHSSNLVHLNCVGTGWDWPLQVEK